MEIVDDMNVKEAESYIARKIANGELLTEREFNLARGFGIYPGQLTYDRFLVSWYVDDEKSGYLRIENGKIYQPREGTLSMFGITRDDIKEEYLTEKQKKLL